MKRLGTLLLAVLLPVLGFGAEKSDLVTFIEKADSVQLLSIYPQQVHVTDEHGNPTEKERKKERFLGYHVLGKIVDLQGPTRTSVREALIAMLSSVEAGPPLLCFEPRHAVCLKQGGMHIDMLICFECQQAKIRRLVMRDNQEVSEREETVPIGPAGQDILNRILDSRKIERDVPKKEPNSERSAAPEHAAERGLNKPGND